MNRQVAVLGVSVELVSPTKVPDLSESTGNFCRYEAPWLPSYLGKLPYGQKTQPNSGSTVYRVFRHILAGNLDLLISCGLSRMLLFFGSGSRGMKYGVCIASLAFIGFDLVGAD